MHYVAWVTKRTPLVHEIGARVKGMREGTGLTQREVAVLRWASVGRRIPETARALGLSEETLRTHIKNAREKLRTHSVAHAVAEAMRLRLFP